ncbi:MAG: hypothetical protein ACW986_08300 [Promethearchaeota archaeon]|jgi:hypothetical protein
MSKAVSYYDWNLSFKQNTPSKPNDKGLINSLGMTDNNFKDFMQKWKEENLS